MDKRCNRERLPRSGARRVPDSYFRSRRPDHWAWWKSIWEFRLLHQLPDCSAIGLNELISDHSICPPCPTQTRRALYRDVIDAHSLARRYAISSYGAQNQFTKSFPAVNL